MIGAAFELGVVGSLISLDKLVWAPGNSVGGYCETSNLEITLAMDAQPVAPLESYVDLWVKCTNSAE